MNDHMAALEANWLNCRCKGGVKVMTDNPPTVFEQTMVLKNEKKSRLNISNNIELSARIASN